MQVDPNKLLAVSYIYVSRDQVDPRNVFGGFLPFILAVGDAKEGGAFDAHAISTRLRNSFGWQVGGDFVALYQDDLVRHGFVQRDGDRLKWTAKAAPAQDVDAQARIDSLRASFFEFSSQMAGGLLANRNADERLHDLATALVSNRLFSEDALRELANSEPAEADAPPDSQTIDYVCARYVKHCYLTERENYLALATLCQLGIVCQLATFFARPPPAEKVNRKLLVALDGPFLVDLLGFGGEDRRSDAELIIRLARKRKARVALFSHSLEEAQDIIRGTLTNEPSMRFGSIAAALRRGSVSQAILDAFVQTPRRIVEKTRLIDEFIEKDDRRFTGRNEYFDTDDWRSLYAALSTWKDLPRQRDCDSVRNVMRLRGDTAGNSVWNSQIVMLTSNQELARIAKQICVSRDILRPQDVGPVVSRFQIAALLWLDGAEDEKSEIVSTHLMAAASAFLTRDHVLVGRVQKYAWNVGKERKELVEAFVSQPLTYEFLQDATLGGVRRVDDSVVSDVLRRLVEHGREEGAELERVKIATEIEGGKKTTQEAQREAEEAAKAARLAETQAAEAQRAQQLAEENTAKVEASARKEMARAERARQMLQAVLQGREERWASLHGVVFKAATASRWLALLLLCGLIGAATALATKMDGVGVITFLSSATVFTALFLTKLLDHGRVIDGRVSEWITKQLIESDRQAFSLELGPAAPSVELDFRDAALTIHNRQSIIDGLMT